ncbi:MAG: restriction endonuclease subunit S [Bacteroidota bacterium]|nr:restriction endonuclease subunit S [Bacteroidota bacterium]
MNWIQIELGKLIKIKHGWAFKGDYFSDVGEYVLLSPGNFNNEGGLKLKGEKEKYYIGDFPEGYLLKKGDVLIVMTDLVNSAPMLGGSLRISEDNKYLHNQRLGLIEIIDDEKIDIGFMYHLFNSPYYRGTVRGSASGVTVRHTAPERIYRINVKIPACKDEQIKIATILKSYDDLIENNLRRIELLEKSAQLLYKEWFVHLRFPGYEHTKIIDGVPEGWEKKKLGEVILLNYGKSLKAEKRNDGNIPVYGSSGIVGNHNEAIVKGQGIIVGRKGNAGSVFWSQSDFFSIDTTYYVSNEQSNLFLYYNLKNQNFQSSHGAVPGLNRDSAYAKNIIIPEEKIMNEFLYFTNPIYQQIYHIEKINSKLIKARDFLLPKLINGEIEV